KEYGMKQPVLGSMTTADEGILRQMGDEALGVVTGGWYAAGIDSAENKRFVAAVNKEYGVDPGYYTLGAYSAAALVEAAAQAVKGRVTRINLPGFGRSSPVQLDSVGAHADHVARVMGALELPRDTDVFGNGFGAFVALELAIRHGARFRRLVVADTLAVFPEAAR